ncbi:hypothetical protein ACEYYB_12820 [Paracoccus sp. p4-l81]
MTRSIPTAAENAAMPGTAKAHFRDPNARRINRGTGMRPGCPASACI